MSSPEWLAESEAHHLVVRGEIQKWGPSVARFEELALAIARYQTEHVSVIRRLTDARGIDVGRLTTIDDFPAVPTDVFRMRRVAVHPPEHDVRVFRTSGTMNGQRGAHAFRDLGTYEAAALASAKRMLWDVEPDRLIVLAPSAREVTDSSLSYMIDLFASHLRVPTTHHLGPNGLDWSGLTEAIRRANEDRARVLVLATSFAFVFLLDGIAEGKASHLELPTGSRAMLTGGFKGRTREVDEAELRRMLTSTLGLDPENIIGEYGMTELTSQLYQAHSASHRRPYVPPPWMRITAVDPVTLSPLPSGREGLCRIVDLGNVDSAIAVQTSDWVKVESDGVTLLGRAKGAVPRGCSLAIEEIFSESGA